MRTGLGIIRRQRGGLRREGINPSQAPSRAGRAAQAPLGRLRRRHRSGRVHCRNAEPDTYGKIRTAGRRCRGYPVSFDRRIIHVERVGDAGRWWVYERVNKAGQYVL